MKKIEGAIPFEKWKEKPQEYKNSHYNLEITFEEWAACGKEQNKSSENALKKALKGTKLFYITDENYVPVSLKKIDGFPKEDEFVKNGNSIIRYKNYEFNGRKLQEKKITQPYGVAGIYTILFFWCLNKHGEKIIEANENDYNYLLDNATDRYVMIKINQKETKIDIAVNNEKLYPRAQYLFEHYLKDYPSYKVILADESEANNNGGKENMSDKTENEMEINKYITEKIDAHKQIIFTGAPGTGKTHSVREYVKGKNDEYKEKMKSTDKKHEDIEDIEDIYKFVQFHSSYDYTDFVEGIRPAPKEKNGENMFVRMDGTFKAFCRKIVNANIKDLKKHGIDNIEALYKIMKESKTDTDAIKERRKNIAKAISELPMYYFVIDEINRADLSKVFGELMFGLEEDYRGVQNRFPTQYHNLPTYEMGETETNNDSKMDTQSQKVKKVKKLQFAKEIEDDCFKNGFFVPENLTIIGTMNDIDRSVETFDFALRRRFAWVEIKANEVMLYSVASINNKSKDEVEDIVKKIQEMNEIISGEGKKLGLNESYHIGPAYFKNLFDGNGKDNRDTIFNEKIEPILREYTRGRDSDTIQNFVTKCRKKLLGIKDDE